MTQTYIVYGIIAITLIFVVRGIIKFLKKQKHKGSNACSSCAFRAECEKNKKSSCRYKESQKTH